MMLRIKVPILGLVEKSDLLVKKTLKSFLKQSVNLGTESNPSKETEDSMQEAVDFQRLADH